VLYEIMQPPLRLKNAITSRIKVMAQLDIAERRLPQDGRIKTRSAGGREVELRISSMPTAFGEKIVMRIFDPDIVVKEFAQLGFSDEEEKTWRGMVERPHGIVLVTGPTGSGKTTTLYSALSDLNKPGVNISTAEDPVEYNLHGINQVQMHDEIGLNFAAALRAFLRQDPDVIMVGEIRDAETARIAMQAAITGHLVFSTVHTTGTIGTIFRLLDLGVEPYLIAQGLHLVLAQRLVRQLCPYCKKPTRPTAEQAARLPDGGKGINKIYVPGGCPRCLSTGYSGRRAFFELLSSNDALRDVIIKTPSMQDVEKALATTRFEKLQQTGYQLVAEGVVAFDEIEKAVGR
jgi:type IV pilus assembly protein PilB